MKTDPIVIARCMRGYVYAIVYPYEVYKCMYMHMNINYLTLLVLFLKCCMSVTHNDIHLHTHTHTVVLRRGSVSAMSLL